ARDEVEHLLVPAGLVGLGGRQADDAAGRVRARLVADVAEPARRVGLHSDLVQAERQAAAGLLADRPLRRAVAAVVGGLVDPRRIRDARVGRGRVALRERLGL